MDSFEWNKIAGALLAACMAILGIYIITGHLFLVKPLKALAFPHIDGVEVAAKSAGPAAAEGPPLAVLLASASPEKGAQQFKKCATCHDNSQGGPNKIGPNLWGIVGGVHAHAASFAYSSSLAAMKGKPWTWEALNDWIEHPKEAIPGNKMSFAGLAKPEDRAAVLVYLNQQSSKPLPLPPIPAKTADAAKPEGGAAPEPAVSAGGADATKPSPTAENAAPAAKDAAAAK